MPFFAGGYEDSLFAQQVLLTVEQVSAEKETPFFSTSKPSVCQDRLGTNGYEEVLSGKVVVSSTTCRDRTSSTGRRTLCTRRCKCRLSSFTSSPTWRRSEKRISAFCFLFFLQLFMESNFVCQDRFGTDIKNAY